MGKVEGNSILDIRMMMKVKGKLNLGKQSAGKSRFIGLKLDGT